MAQVRRHRKQYPVRPVPFIGGVQKQPLRVLLQGGLRNRPGQLVIRRSLAHAIADARAALADDQQGRSTGTFD